MPQLRITDERARQVRDAHPDLSLAAAVDLILARSFGPSDEEGKPIPRLTPGPASIHRPKRRNLYP